MKILKGVQPRGRVWQHKKRIFSVDIILLQVRPLTQHSIWREWRKPKFVSLKLGLDCLKPCKRDVGCDCAVAGEMQSFVIKPIVDLDNPKLLRGLLDKQPSYHRIQEPDEVVVVGNSRKYLDCLALIIGQFEPERVSAHSRVSPGSSLAKLTLANLAVITA